MSHSPLRAAVGFPSTLADDSTVTGLSVSADVDGIYPHRAPSASHKSESSLFAGMDFFSSDAAAKDSGDDSPNAQKKPFISESVNALSEDLAQFATGSAVTDAARSAAAASAASLVSGDPVSTTKDNRDQLDLLSDFQPNTASSPIAPADSSTPSYVEDLLNDALPANAPLLKPSAPPAPDKVAPPAAVAEPDLEPRREPKNLPPPKQTTPEPLPVADVKPTLPPVTSSKPKAAEMPREETSTTSFAKDRPSCCIFSPGSGWSPACLHPCVEELVYWRQPKKSGLVFGLVLAVLLSLTCFSLISVVAYLALGSLMVAIAFRVYRNVLQAVQKSAEGHPFKEYLEKDLSLPKERVHETVDVVVKHVDATVARLRSLFLVEDLVDSLKLALLFWVLTYVGSWFNGMTLIILAYVSAFTLPKVYETYKTEIDQYLGLARTHVGNVIGAIKSKIPMGGQPAQRPKEE
ncbi:reticulon isoform X1 [Dermacentor variabilis]|uniref:reticulon isoform X1 n=1 Tax=Dermacentor variabilis TaxID=34621 RepID=UPI003F5B357D